MGVGLAVLGRAVGRTEGLFVGRSRDGRSYGFAVGIGVGYAEGRVVGRTEGLGVGFRVG